MSILAADFHPEDYGGAVLVSLGLHALVILLLTVNLSFCDTTVELPVPAHVKAVVLDRTPPRRPVVPKPLQDVAIPDIEMPAPLPPKPPEPKAAPKPQPVEKVPEKPVAVERPKPAAPDFGALLDEEQQTRAARDAAQRETAQRDAAMRAQQNQKVLQDYQVLIAAEVQRRWIPSPGARPGLKTVLRISLLPGGEVQDVTVVKSSGDAMFDHSAENAVRLAARLPVPADPALFAEFRSFKFTFDPRR